jgi:hypothetical protein
MESRTSPRMRSVALVCPKKHDKVLKRINPSIFIE